jgi:hypothetical protein
MTLEVWKEKEKYPWVAATQLIPPLRRNMALPPRHVVACRRSGNKLSCIGERVNKKKKKYLAQLPAIAYPSIVL